MFDKISWTAGTFHPVISMKRAYDKMQAGSASFSTPMLSNFDLFDALDRSKKFVIFEPFSELATHGQVAMDSFITSYHYVLGNFFNTSVDDLALASISMLEEYQRGWIILVKEYLDKKYINKDIRIGITQAEAIELGDFITNVCLAVKAIGTHKEINKRVR